VNSIGQVIDTEDAALRWADRLGVQVGGAGTVAQAGVALPRLLADRLGLTEDLAGVVSRAGFTPVRHRGRAIVDAAAALAAGATCLSDIEAMTSQVELFGPGGGCSDTTMLRVLDELAGRLNGDGLPGRRLARAQLRARTRAWQAITDRHGGLPAVRVAGRDLLRQPESPPPASSASASPALGASSRPVLVVRVDATLIDVASDKQRAAGTYKKGWGFHPMTAWCSNVGDALAVMMRPGNAGSFTASDHLLVLTAAFGQIPVAHRGDVLVTIDGAGASHEVINYLTALNTARTHGRRGRRVEYSIGWPVDTRTLTAIGGLREHDWGPSLAADGTVEAGAQVVDLTGVLRTGLGGDQLGDWPDDLRIFGRRTPRPVGKPAQLGQDPNFEYGAVATNTPGGQVQQLEARHRTQAHVEDRIKQFKACGAANLPSIDYARNQAWAQLAALAVTLTAWLRHTALDGQLAKAATKTLRYRILSAPGRLVSHARTRILKIPPGWAWAHDIATAWTRIQALHPT